MDETLWALWGLLGAFSYAALSLIASLFDPPGGVRRPAKAIATFLVSLTAGPIAAAGLGPILAAQFLGSDVAHCRAAALIIGVIVNPVMPAAIDLFSENVLRLIGHPLAKKGPPPP